MNLEILVSNMMKMSVVARLWHWTTSQAQHHVAYEAFLTQNEALTDRFVEASLGNDIALNFKEIGVEKAIEGDYSLEDARSKIVTYRNLIFETKETLEKQTTPSSSELVTILDDVTELCSKTLYLIKLS